MNGKKAKALRKHAESIAIGKEKTHYEGGIPPVFNNIYDDFGRVIGSNRVYPGIPRVLIKSCTRGVYKALKKRA